MKLASIWQMLSHTRNSSQTCARCAFPLPHNFFLWRIAQLLFSAFHAAEKFSAWTALTGMLHRHMQWPMGCGRISNYFPTKHWQKENWCINIKTTYTWICASSGCTIKVLALVGGLLFNKSAFWSWIWSPPIKPLSWRWLNLAWSWMKVLL